jgi:hypothetical protein
MRPHSLTFDILYLFFIGYALEFALTHPGATATHLTAACAARRPGVR